MTRDEAEQKLCPGKPCSLSVEAARFVDWSARLGMLKLDEPSRHVKKLAAALQEIGIAVDQGPIQFALNTLDLQLVELTSKNEFKYNSTTVR